MPLSSAVEGKQELCQGSPAGFARGKGCSLQGFFQVLASEDVQEEEFAPLYNICWFLMYSDNNTDTQMLSLVLSSHCQRAMTG